MSLSRYQSLSLKCSENCILYLRNRHVVILSSLKLWEKGTVSIFVFTRFPFSIYFLRHFAPKTMRYPVSNWQYQSFARRQRKFLFPFESWSYGGKVKIFMKRVFAILSVAVGLTNGGQTSLAAPLHGSV